MAYYTKGARTLGDVDWGQITSEVTSQVFTPENVKAATQAAGGMLQQFTQQFIPKAAPPPPPPVKPSGVSPLLVIGGLGVVGFGVYLLMKRK